MIAEIVFAFGNSKNLMPLPKLKSFGQAFTKACGFLGQSPKSSSAEDEIPHVKTIFCRGLGRFFHEKKRPK
ncbi:MAG: hypothetical protein ACI4J1_08825, partial [Ruminiclostridium sp.]